MNKHEIFDEIYAEYKVEIGESNTACYEETFKALCEFNVIARAAEVIRCSQYNREKMFDYLKKSDDLRREAWQRRDARQNALNDELKKKCQAIGV